MVKECLGCGEEVDRTITPCPGCGKERFCVRTLRPMPEIVVNERTPAPVVEFPSVDEPEA